MLRAASFLRVQTLFWAFLLLVTLPAGAALVFQDDFDDGVVGPEFQPIGGAVLTESGGSLHVQVPDSGGGFSFRLPAPVESTCGFFDGLVLPPSAKGDYINIDLIADDGNGNFVVDSSFRVTRTNSVTISGRDKNGTMHAWKIEDQNPENIVKQWIDKLSGDRRQYEVKFDDGTVWRSPPIDPPDLRIAGYDVTTSMESIEVGQIAAEDEHHPRDQIPVEVDVAIDRLDTLARPNRDGTARTTLAHATVLVGAKLLDITTIDLATVELVSLDGLLQSQPQIKRDQDRDGDNRNVVRQGNDLPKLCPIHTRSVTLESADKIECRYGLAELYDAVLP